MSNRLLKTLNQLKEYGFYPKNVLDIGARVGQWSLLCNTIFPNANYELIEPIPYKKLIQLSENKTISIYRGGCDELFLEATIILNGRHEFSNQLINQNIIKITKLFPNEYQETLVKDCLKNNCLNMTKEGYNNYYGNFMRHELYELLTVYFKIENDKTHITLGTYL